MFILSRRNKKLPWIPSSQLLFLLCWRLRFVLNRENLHRFSIIKINFTKLKTITVNLNYKMNVKKSQQSKWFQSYVNAVELVYTFPRNNFRIDLLLFIHETENLIVYNCFTLRNKVISITVILSSYTKMLTLIIMSEETPLFFFL